MLFVEDHMERAVPEKSASRNSPKVFAKQHESVLVSPEPGREVRHILEQLFAEDGIDA